MAKYCIQCGTALNEGARFCGQCGAVVPVAGVDSPAPASEPPAATPAYAAVEVAVAASSGGATTGIGLFGRLDEDEFKTAIGPVRFDSKGDLAASPYRAYRYDGQRFVPRGGE